MFGGNHHNKYAKMGFYNSCIWLEKPLFFWVMLYHDAMVRAIQSFLQFITLNWHPAFPKPQNQTSN